MSKLPTTGPVQLKETKVKVKAIKKIPAKFPMLLLESILLTNACGNVISNMPKNDAANTKKMTKNKTFGNQCVLNQFPKSGPKPKNAKTNPSDA